MHMRPVAALAVLLFALPVLAQGVLERPPVGLKEIQRAEDRLAARRALDLAAKERPLRSARLKDAIRDFNAADFPVAPLHVDFGQFVTVKNHPFVAMHFAPGGEAKVPENGKVTFFAAMTDEGGRTIWSREEPVELTRDATGARWYARSFPFPAMNATGTFGLAVGDQPIAMAAVPMQLTPLDKDARRLSRLIVSNHVAPMEKMQVADEPFAFGGIKVVPKSDRTFRKSEELWIFYEAQNPAVDGAGAPKLVTKVQLEAGEGKVYRGLVGTAEALPLKGTPGRFGVGTVVDLTRVPPGQYLVRVAVSDALAAAEYELVEKVTILE